MSRQFTIPFALLAIVLASCSTSPPVHYYNLEPDLISDSNDNPYATMIGMGPLRLPDYLRRSRMVTRGAGSEIMVHEHARWAEPIDKAIHRVLAANVDSRLNEAILVAYPYLESVQVKYTVVGQVSRFDSNERGEVRLDVQWAVLDEKRAALIAPQRDSYQARANNPDDPNQVARAMNEALNQFSDDIAAELSHSLP